MQRRSTAIQPAMRRRIRSTRKEEATECGNRSLPTARLK